eukprot:TCONS_00069717-protein
MKYCIFIIVLLLVVLITECAPMMEGCKRWNGCVTSKPKKSAKAGRRKKTNIKNNGVVGIPKDMARHFLRKLIESKDFMNKFTNKQGQTSPDDYDMGRKIVRKFRISLRQQWHQT